MQTSSNPIGALFDFSFDRFISVTLIQILYLAVMVVAALGALAMIAGAFVSEGFWVGIITLFLLAPLSFLAVLIYARLVAELFIVLFRIAQNTSVIRDELRGSADR